MAVSKNAGKSGQAAQTVRNRNRKSRNSVRKIVPVHRDGRAGDFPVPGRRVLAGRDFRGAGVAPLYTSICVERRRHAAGGEPTGLTQTEAREIRQVNRATPKAGTVGISGSARF